MIRALRLPLSLVAFTALGAAVALLVLLLAPLTVGGRAAVVASGSMEPALRTGDVVLLAGETAAQARIGDVVVIDDGKGRQISHRLLHRRLVDGAVELTTRGDANPTEETWRFEPDAQIGRVVLRVPAMGAAVTAARERGLHLPLLLLPAGVLLALEMWDLRRPAGAVVP